jgi:transcriptional repressor NrdR
MPVTRIFSGNCRGIAADSSRSAAAWKKEVRAMKCPFCGDQESKVVDSRHSDDGLSIRRRRECCRCFRRFTTYEVVETLPIIVVKRNGSRQPFDRNKILNSMIRAFDKRKVDVADLDRITTEIEQTIQNTLEREITSDKLGEMVMERLKPLDEVAYIRFASIYHQFQDANSFMREISKYLEEK